MALPRLALLVLYCGDPDSCRDFYTGLGLTFAREQHGTGPRHWAAVLGDGCVLELYPATTSARTGTVRIGLTVSAATAGLQPGRQVRHDPDGRAVEILAETGP
jgi:catechol 2,3-dioxygenase-like lactoylglutathione lyase family enzyme